MESMSTKLIDWITKEINLRGWSVRELARRAYLSHATINGVLTEKAGAGPDFCTGIARAFRVPPDQVFRLAGLLPTVIIDKEEDANLLDYFHYMDPGDRVRLLAIARTFYESRAGYDESSK